jgi:serine/threonine-protein kinase
VRTLGGRYQLEQRIGVGGMSEVWRGYDEVLARPVAVKLLNPEQAADHNADGRAQTEAQSAAQLAHPNVANVYDFGMSPFLPGRPAPYIVMELVEGATLADHLAGGPLDWHIAVRISAEVSAALAAAHTHDIIHRDIKPANIMLTPSGAKVLDFGIATGSGQYEPQPNGTVLGTPAYLAPERLRGEPATPASDMYALGVLLFQCLTGRLPWPGETATQLLRERCSREPDPLPAIAGMAPEAADLCAHCLSEDPAERPTSHVAALVLAEAVDARVYVPPVALLAPPSDAPAAGARSPRSTRMPSRFDMPTHQAPSPQRGQAGDGGGTAKEGTAKEGRAREGSAAERKVTGRGGTGRERAGRAGEQVGRHRAPTGPSPIGRDRPRP